MVTWQLTIDANDPSRLARFWAPVLGYEPQPPPDGFASWVDWYRSVGEPEEELADLGDDFCDRIRDPAGRGPTIWFQAVPEEKAGKNRLHLDIYPTHRDRSIPLAERRRIVDDHVAGLVAAGATIDHPYLDESSYFVVMHDPEGNEFCVA